MYCSIFLYTFKICPSLSSILADDYLYAQMVTPGLSGTAASRQEGGQQESFYLAARHKLQSYLAHELNEYKLLQAITLLEPEGGLPPDTPSLDPKELNLQHGIPHTS